LNVRLVVALCAGEEESVTLTPKLAAQAEEAGVPLRTPEGLRLIP
jgi:hypothetical protein